MALPKRATNVKAKAVRERSYSKAQTTKQLNKMDNEARHRQNITRGYTGKQLDNAYRKYAKLHDLSYRELHKSIGTTQDLVIALEMGLV